MEYDEDFVATARKRAEHAKSAWADVYQSAELDLAFLSDEEDAQWDEKTYRQRVQTGRPVVTVDQLTQFVNQVVNDIRMNTPTIKAVPGDNSDQETAEIIDGLIKDIEYESSADEAYDTAAMFSVKSSFGFIRVDHDYVSEKSFNQRLCIKRVINPLAVLLDPDSIELDGSDAKYAFFFDEMSVDEFKKKYPNHEPKSFFDAPGKAKVSDKDKIVIAEYFTIEEHTKTVIADPMGNMVMVDEVPPGAKSRTITKKKVKRCKLCGDEKPLEEGYFPGEYIPIVPVYGQEAWQNGVRYLHSLIRKAKSPQKMFNVWKSLETEILQKQPMAPVLAAAGQTENYAEDWLDPSKAGVLRYDVADVNGRPLPAPQRLMPPSYPAAFAQAARSSVDDIKGSMGLYNASIGARSNETSGVAIAQRKQEGDVATFHFGDNLVKSIQHVGRIIVSALKHVYDTPRLIRTIDGEEKPKIVGINGMMAPGQKRPYDLTKGEYSVRVITGPAFTTQRQEAAAFFAEMAQRFPQMMQVAGDLVFRYADVPGAQAIADRLEKTLPPELREPEEGEEAPDAEKVQMQQMIQAGQEQIAAMQTEIANLTEQLNNKRADLTIKAESERSDAEIEVMKLRLEEQKMKMDAEIKAATIALKERELAIKEREQQIRALEMQQAAQESVVMG